MNEPKRLRGSSLEVKFCPEHPARCTTLLPAAIQHLGQEGWCLGCELRPGSQHANNGFLETLKRVLPRARVLTDSPILLRWMGLRLTGPNAPVRHPAKRRRLRTVMQELMTMACRLVHSGRQWVLRFGRHCPGFAVYRDLYRGLASSG